MRVPVRAVLPALFAVNAMTADVRLSVSDAEWVKDGQLGAAELSKDAFGDGEHGVVLRGSPSHRMQLHWTCASLRAGTYWLGVRLAPGPSSHYLVGESAAFQLKLYLNDTPFPWGSHTEPRHPRSGSRQSAYACELRSADPVEIGPADTVRVVHLHTAPWSWTVVGDLCLYGEAPYDGALPLDLAPQDESARPRPDPYWLRLEWGEAEESGVGSRVAQPLILHNPGVRARRVTVEAVARDYVQTELLGRQETVSVPALGQRRLVFAFSRSETARDSLFVTVRSDSPGCRPIHRSRFWVHDIRSGPRRRFGLSGQWEVAFLPGPDTGESPPDDAQWEATNVPSELPNSKGHCAWFRRTFECPPFLEGDRTVLFFDHVLSETRVLLNGKQVGFLEYGTEPFEVDVTQALQPEGKNTLLVAVRDWIAYSPKNQERLREGRKAIFKDHMKGPAGYTLARHLGIRGPVWVETRPAVSVSDVAVVTRVEAKRLEVIYTLANAGGEPAKARVEPVVLDRGRPLFALKRRRVKVPAHGSAQVSFSRRWREPVPWWPGQPHLYTLQTTVTGGGTPDRHIQRFGFRDIRIDGTSFLVNGVRMKLRSQWTSGATGASRRRDWDPATRLQSIWDWQSDCIHNRATQVSRTHNHVGVREICEMADESGLMLKIENGHVCQQKFSFSKTYWEAVLASEAAMVNAYKNHASVFFWSAGNENMWGWAYQGEATRTLGNRWQVRVAQAMTEADPMKRPVEWESDGDLMGKWDYHSLHYPRELNRHPDMPDGAWWGRLDGETVVKYSMGDITLGEKPLTVGEAYWPANMNRPWGCSILLGDLPFTGGNVWRRGWSEACRFLTNGLRDAEFALIDIYASLPELVPPQALVLKDEESQFFGGRTVRRRVNVHHDLRARGVFTLAWSLAGEEAVAGGERRLVLGPADVKRLSLDVPLPEVSRPADMRFRMELREDGGTTTDVCRSWRVFPEPALACPAGLELTVYDPGGRAAEVLRSLGVPFKSMAQLAAPRSGALVIGPKALTTPPEGGWREALAGFVRGGGKVLVLAQDAAPDFLPVRLTQSKSSRTTMAFVRAGDHPALRGLKDGDLRWWADGHAVSFRNFRKPTRGNWLPLIDAGTVDGPVETPLIEQYDGKGSVLLCQMPIASRARSAPQALALLQNLLDYLAAPSPYRAGGRTVLLAEADCGLRGVAADSRLVYESAGPDLVMLQDADVDVVLVDGASLAESTAGPLRSVAERGGTVFVHRPVPGSSAIRALTGVDWHFLPVEKEPREVQFMCLRRADSGLMAGISNHELYWSSGRHKRDLQHEGGWWSAYEVEPAERIADWYLEPDAAAEERVTRLTRPGGLAEVPVGKGRVVLSTLRLDEPVPALAVTVTRLRSLLLTNLGCTLRGDGGAARARRERLRTYDFFTVDLAPYANRGYRDEPAKAIVGWTNQGENDMRDLPTGRQRFADIPFHLASPKGVVALHSLSANNAECPKEVRGIKVGRRADVLFFLHTMAWGAPLPFRYRINYADGAHVMFEVRDGQHVVDWWSEPTRYAEATQRHGLFFAWQGDNPMHKGVVLPGCEWANPHPGKLVETVDFLTVPESGYRPVPVLVAISGAVASPSQGVVVDIIGTRGVKVQLGTTVQDVYYIGVAGIPPGHSFREQALAEHRALVVGKAVSLLDAAVTRNARGERMAYVYLGKDTYNARELVNARIIGDGLGKLGGFEGNNRQRMYLENLGFIAGQKRNGLWGAEE